MDDDSELTVAPARDGYKSRPGALIWFFRKSRDNWKRKYRDLKATVKGYHNRIADLTKSRDRWRIEAERAAERFSASEAENATLRARIAAVGGEKSG